MSWRVVGVGLALVLLAGCSSGGSEVMTLEGSVTGIAQFGGEGNHDGLVNAKECRVNEDVDEYYKVTSYASGDGELGDLGHVTVELAHCNSDAGPTDGQIAFTTDDGDTLYGEYEGVTITFLPESTSGECFLLGANDGTVECRSTGRFADASGTATMLANPQQTDPDPFVPWSFEATFQSATATAGS